MDEYLYVRITALGTTYSLLTEPIIPESDKKNLGPGEVVFMVKPIDMFHGGHFHQLQNGSNNG